VGIHVSAGGGRKNRNIGVDFDRQERLDFHGSKISSNGGLLLFRELQDVLGHHDLAGSVCMTRTGHKRPQNERSCILAEPQPYPEKQATQ